MTSSLPHTSEVMRRTIGSLTDHPDAREKGMETEEKLPANGSYYEIPDDFVIELLEIARDLYGEDAVDIVNNVTTSYITKHTRPEYWDRLMAIKRQCRAPGCPSVVNHFHESVHNNSGTILGNVANNQSTNQ